MPLQVKDPALPSFSGTGIKALAEQGAGSSAALGKVALGTAATRDVGLSEGNVIALGSGGAIPASLLAGYEPAHRLIQWSSADRTVAAGDNGGYLRALHSAPVLTLPSGAMPDNMMLTGSTVSDMTISAPSGVTINGVSSVIVPAGAGFQLWRTTTNIWFVVSSGGSATGAWPMVAVPGPTYALTAADKNRVLVVSTAVSFTIASDLGEGFQTSVLNVGAGQPSFTADTGVPVTSDGTAPLRMIQGPSACALFRPPGGQLCILGLYRVSASFAVATASDYWTVAAGLLIPTPQAFAAAEVEQTAAPALTISGSNLTLNGGYFWNAYLNLTASSINISSISGIDGHARRLRIRNSSGGACSVTVDAAYARANFGAGISIPTDGTAAFVIEATGGEVLVTFAGYGD